MKIYIAKKIKSQQLSFQKRKYVQMLSRKIIAFQTLILFVINLFL